MSTAVVKETLPPTLDSTSQPPNLFDGTTKLYTSYICPYAQRTWIARNFKGLQEKIQLVPINLQDKPSWYKEKVYAENKVPSLEHNNKVMGESIDLVRYIDKEFDGPTLMPNDPEKKKFGEELISYSDHFVSTNFASCRSKEEAEAEVGEVYNKLEDALSKFEDGPFFLGQFSMVDIVYAPFLERFNIFHNGVKNYDITKGRPRLALWFQEVEKIEAFTHTKCDPQEHLAVMKLKFGIN